MIIDSHLHVWALARGDYDWLTPNLSCLYADHDLPDILPVFKQQGVGQCILVQAAATRAETLYLLQQAKKYRAFVGGVVGWIDFASEQVFKDLDEWAHEPLLVGVRPMLQDIQPDDWILQDQFNPVFTALSNRGLVFDALVRHHQLSVVYHLACRYPSLKIVIDHCGKPELDSDDPQPWLTDLARLAQCPAVTIKLSGLAAQSSSAFDPQVALFYVRQVIALFGANRVMWGSDWPVVKRGSDYFSWLSFCQRSCASLGLSKQQQSSIFNQTATRVYGLSVCPENNE